MTSDRWERVKELFDASLEKSPKVRLKFLSEACSGDEELFREVERLISEHEGVGSFLASPPWANTTGPTQGTESPRGVSQAGTGPESTGAAVWLKRGDTFTSRYEIK